MTIYRNLELTKTGQKLAGVLIQDLITSGGTITSMSHLTNGFTADQVRYWSTFYRLRFPDDESLQVFGGKGWVTTTPCKVGIHPMEIDNDDN